MSQLYQPSPGTLFFSLIANETVDILELKNEFADWGIWSEAHFEYNPSFDYYSKEMGQELKRWFWIGKTVPRDKLVEAKTWAQELEEKYSLDGKRSLNCDPGLVCLEHMILATGKSYAHRVHIKSGVFAELTYIYEASAFKSLQWTYPDYQHEDKLELFNLLRSRLLQKVSD